MTEISMEKAGAGARFGSYIIDLIIVEVAALVVGFVFMIIVEVVALVVGFVFIYLMHSILGLAIPFGYYTYFFGKGQTLGMKAARIKLCGTGGTYPVGYGKGFLRCIGMIISGLVIGLGYLWILIDENKQGWHDKIAGTFVVVE